MLGCSGQVANAGSGISQSEGCAAAACGSGPLWATRPRRPRPLYRAERGGELPHPYERSGLPPLGNPS